MSFVQSPASRFIAPNSAVPARKSSATTCLAPSAPLSRRASALRAKSKETPDVSKKDVGAEESAASGTRAKGFGSAKKVAASKPAKKDVSEPTVVVVADDSDEDEAPPEVVEERKAPADDVGVDEPAEQPAAEAAEVVAGKTAGDVADTSTTEKDPDTSEEPESDKPSAEVEEPEPEPEAAEGKDEGSPDPDAGDVVAAREAKPAAEGGEDEPEKDEPEKIEAEKDEPEKVEAVKVEDEVSPASVEAAVTDDDGEEVVKEEPAAPSPGADASVEVETPSEVVVAEAEKVEDEKVEDEKVEDEVPPASVEVAATDDDGEEVVKDEPAAPSPGAEASVEVETPSEVVVAEAEAAAEEAKQQEEEVLEKEDAQVGGEASVADEPAAEVVAEEDAATEGGTSKDKVEPEKVEAVKVEDEVEDEVADEKKKEEASAPEEEPVPAAAAAGEVVYTYSGPEPKRFAIAEGQTGEFLAATLGAVLRLFSGGLAVGHSFSLGQAEEGTYTLAKVAGRQINESSLISTFRRPSQPLEIYEFEGCPFCKKVREAVSILALDVIFYPCPRDGPTWRVEAGLKGGKKMFPYMLDPGAGVAMYESDDIIRYLFNEYGDGEVPFGLNLGVLTALSCSVSLLPRIGKGSVYRESKLPEKPIIFWGYEGSPFCKVVKETLGELELPHLMKHVPRGSEKRQELYSIAGSFQVPYIQDPNTGVALFESAAIIEYLNETYAA